MPRDVSGNYTLPASNPVVPFTVITSTWANSTMSDVAAALTQSISANGVTNPSANLPMSGFVHTGAGLATQFNNYARADQVQQQAFAKVTAVELVGAEYRGNLPFGSGLTIPLVDKQMILFTPPATNLANPTMKLSGGTARPIVNVDGTPLAAARFTANQPVALVYNSLTEAWVLIGTPATTINGISTLTPKTLDVHFDSPGFLLIDTRTNISEGLVQLTPATKVPVNLLPIDALTMLGFWNAAPGILPANGSVQGQYYIVTVAGNLNLFTWTGAAYTASVVAVVAGDSLVWMQTAITGQPQGWYRVQKGVVTVASSVTSNPTSTAPAAVNVQSWMDTVDSVNGFLPVSGTRRMTGTLKGPIIAADSTVTGNLDFSTGNWRFTTAANYGWLTTTGTPGPYGRIDYVTTASSGGVGAVAPLADVAYWGFTGSYAKTPWGIGGPPRLVGGAQQYHCDVYGAGSQRIAVNDTTNQVGIKLVAASTGNFLDAIRMDASGGSPVLGGVPFTLRLTDTAGASWNALQAVPGRQIQIGDMSGGSPNNPGSICSTQTGNIGVFVGGISFLAAQTVRCSPGANFSAGITMTTAQIARILVVGAGSITLPAAIKLPRGGAVYGLAFTLIGLYYDGTNTYATFTPYD